MSNTKTATRDGSLQTRWLLIALIVLVAFFASYRFAVAQGSSSASTQVASAAPAAADSLQQAPASAGAAAQGLGTGAASGGCCGGAGAASASGAGSASGGCCGGRGAAGPKVSKQAQAVAGVQKISVDLSSGSYNPSEIVLKAGVPAEITFGQASGCLSQVQSQDLGFAEDLSGGPKTIKLPGLKAGTYSFSCGMGMVFGSVVVK